MEGIDKLLCTLYLLLPPQLSGSKRLDTRSKLSKCSIVNNTSFDNDDLRKGFTLSPHGRAADSTKLTKDWLATAAFRLVSRMLASDDFERGLGYDPVCAVRRAGALVAVATMAQALRDRLSCGSGRSAAQLLTTKAGSPCTSILIAPHEQLPSCVVAMSILKTMTGLAPRCDSALLSAVQPEWILAMS